MITRRGLIAAAAAGMAIPSGSHARTPMRDAPRDIVIDGYPFAHFSSDDRAQRRFGALEFLGGLELRCKDPEFGGISALRVDPDGIGFVAISDHAHWMTGRLIEERGALNRIEKARIAPMLGASGRRLKDTRYFDSESLARAGRYYYVGVERTHDILRFDFGARNMEARGEVISTPAAMKRLNGNQGIEALGVLPKDSPFAGSLLALAEAAPKGSASRDIPGFIIGSKPGELKVRKIGDFNVTDLDFLPGGDLLILERRFVPFFGLGCRIRRVPLGMVRPGAVLDGEVLIEANLGQQIDNMEALAVHQDRDGRSIITLMSDDNFSILQRNLVLRFALVA